MKLHELLETLEAGTHVYIAEKTRLISVSKTHGKSWMIEPVLNIRIGEHNANLKYIGCIEREVDLIKVESYALVVTLKEIRK